MSTKKNLLSKLVLAPTLYNDSTTTVPTVEQPIQSTAESLTKTINESTVEPINDTITNETKLNVKNLQLRLPDESTKESKKKPSLFSRLKQKLKPKKTDYDWKTDLNTNQKENSPDLSPPVTEESEDEEDLEKILEMISAVEEKSLNRTETMKQLLNESKNTGTKTSEELVSQEEKLKNVNKLLDTIEQHLSESQKDINGMKSDFERVTNFFGRIKKKFTDDSKTQTEDEQTEIHHLNDKNTNQEGLTQLDEDILPISEFPTVSGSEKEKVIRTNLTEISKSLNELREMMKSMSSAIDRQSELINDLIVKIDRIKGNIREQEKQLEKMMAHVGFFDRIKNKFSNDSSTNLENAERKIELNIFLKFLKKHKI